MEVDSLTSPEALALAKQEALSTLRVHIPPEVSKRRQRRRKRRPRAPLESKRDIGDRDKEHDGDNVQIEYVLGDVGGEEVQNGEFGELRKVLERFRGREGAGIDETGESEVDVEENEMRTNGEREYENGVKDRDIRMKDRKESIAGRRKRRLAERYSVAELKAEVQRPELVEPWDVTSADPKLLISLKSLPNSVPVPINWKLKRKYLQNKRGMEKPAFQLPAYILDTGIQGMRETYSKAEDKKSLKQKQREKIRPKAHKGAEIDESILRDAFFKFQTKPNLTSHGDLYYEMRELEVSRSNFRSGVLSENLRAALGMTDAKSPPPWLIAMQRYGPPPSYPNLKIPGLNCPIPPGTSFGFDPGNWGKPPVDASGRPIYGDVFNQGIAFEETDKRFDMSAEEKTWLWGEPVEAAEASETPEFQAVIPKEEKSTPAILPDKISVPEEGVELRKGIPARALYQVVQQRDASVGNSMMGSAYTYNLTSISGDQERLLDIGRNESTTTAQETEITRKTKTNGSNVIPEEPSRQPQDVRGQQTQKALKNYKDYKF